MYINKLVNVSNDFLIHQTKLEFFQSSLQNLIKELEQTKSSISGLSSSSSSFSTTTQKKPPERENISPPIAKPLNRETQRINEKAQEQIPKDKDRNKDRARLDEKKEEERPTDKGIVSAIVALTREAMSPSPMSRQKNQFQIPQSTSPPIQRKKSISLEGSTNSFIQLKAFWSSDKKT